MRDKSLLGWGLGLLLVVFLVGWALWPENKEGELGSTPIGGEYHSTTTDASMGGTGATYKEQLLKSGPGTLGSVVITFTSNSKIEIYDATSTVTNTEWGTTTLAKFVTTTAGTYTFDSIFRKGLLIVNPSGNVGYASSTITFR